jgi:uncharacterized protein (TIGR02996 family)
VTDREALFRAILANPDNDTLRLIYADALEEANDTQRAAFIRSQVELAHVPEYDPAWIRFRYIDLEKLYGDLLQEELPELPAGIEWFNDPFRRGLPAAIQAKDAQTFVHHADGLFALAPIEHLILDVVKLQEVQSFARCPWRDRLVRLSISQGLGVHVASRLLSSTHYERLKELYIGAGLTTRGTATAVVRSHTFRQLTALSYRDDRRGRGTEFGSESSWNGSFVSELIQLTEPLRLNKLDLSENRLTGEPLRDLLGTRVIFSVEELDLSDNNLGGDGFRALAAAHLPHLKSLRLTRTRPELYGVRSFCETGFLSKLFNLTLSGNHLPSTVGAVLANSEAVTNLNVLDLSENRLGDEGAVSIANSLYLRNLVHLDLSENQVGDVGADALMESPYLGGIVFLNLSGNNISTNAAVRLKRRYEERVSL